MTVRDAIEVPNYYGLLRRRAHDNRMDFVTDARANREIGKALQALTPAGYERLKRAGKDLCDQEEYAKEHV